MHRFEFLKAGKRPTAVCLAGLALAALWGSPGLRAQQPDPRPDPAPDAAVQAPADVPAGVEVLTRGPIHEAFASVAVTSPEPGMIVPRQPPAPIEEVPPDVGPQGEGYVWISGYWAWDDDRKDFIWISGVWRIPPANSEWVPGYWTKVADGYQWVAGFWSTVQEAAVEYLPAPPPTVDVGPSSPAPDQDYTWSPGIWIWHESRYAWRPGFWVRQRPDWLWTPAHYVWAPSGYVFTDGFWDYPIERRGVLFAPAYFQERVLTTYTPAVVVNPTLLVDSLFVRPNYYHYYFGDYFAASYTNLGFHPWFGSQRISSYDPLFSYYQWTYSRRDPQWATRLRESYVARRNDPALRPAHTYSQLRAGFAQREGRAAPQVAMVEPIRQFAATANSPLRLGRLDRERWTQLRDSAQTTRTFVQQRQRLEAESVREHSGTAANRAMPQRLQLFAQRPQRTPLRTAGAVEGRNPPAMPRVPQVDSRVRPQEDGRVGRRDAENNAPWIKGRPSNPLSERPQGTERNPIGNRDNREMEPNRTNRQLPPGALPTDRREPPVRGRDGINEPPARPGREAGSRDRTVPDPRNGLDRNGLRPGSERLPGEAAPGRPPARERPEAERTRPPVPERPAPGREPPAVTPPARPERTMPPARGTEPPRPAPEQTPAVPNPSRPGERLPPMHEGPRTERPTVPPAGTQVPRPGTQPAVQRPMPPPPTREPGRSERPANPPANPPAVPPRVPPVVPPTVPPGRPNVPPVVPPTVPPTVPPRPAAPPAGATRTPPAGRPVAPPVHEAPHTPPPRTPPTGGAERPNVTRPDVERIGPPGTPAQRGRAPAQPPAKNTPPERPPA